MLSARLLDALDVVGRVVRRQPKKAFGGLQVLLCGDFHQLSSCGPEGSWAFEAKCWPELIEVAAELTQVVRVDTGEQMLVHALSQLREGYADEDAWRFWQRAAARPRDPDRPVVEVVPTNARADKINETELERALAVRTADGNGQVATDGPVVFEAVRVGQMRSQAREAFGSASSNVPERLRLCVGALLVLTKSVALGPDFERVPNGTMCRVVGFNSVSEHLYNVRCPSFDAFAYDSDERKFLAQNGGILPKVRLLGDCSLEGTLNPECFFADGCRGGRCGDMASSKGAVQLPVRLGWALTAHRVQGTNLGAAVVHLRGLFAAGHAYVALSRVRRADDLWIEGGLPERSLDGSVPLFRPSPKVVSFYQKLRQAGA